MVTDANQRSALEMQIQEFGQTPKQLFVGAHPARGDVGAPIMLSARADAASSSGNSSSSGSGSRGSVSAGARGVRGRTSSAESTGSGTGGDSYMSDESGGGAKTVSALWQKPSNASIKADSSSATVWSFDEDLSDSSSSSAIVGGVGGLGLGGAIRSNARSIGAAAGGGEADLAPIGVITLDGDFHAEVQRQLRSSGLQQEQQQQAVGGSSPRLGAFDAAHESSKAGIAGQSRQGEDGVVAGRTVPSKSLFGQWSEKTVSFISSFRGGAAPPVHGPVSATATGNVAVPGEVLDSSAARQPPSQLPHAAKVSESSSDTRTGSSSGMSSTGGGSGSSSSSSSSSVGNGTSSTANSSSSRAVEIPQRGPLTASPAGASCGRVELEGDIRKLSLQPSEHFRVHSMGVTSVCIVVSDGAAVDDEAVGLGSATTATVCSCGKDSLTKVTPF